MSLFSTRSSPPSQSTGRPVQTIPISPHRPRRLAHLRTISWRNRIVIVSILVGLIGGGYWWYTHRTPAKQPTATTSTHSPTKKPIVSTDRVPTFATILPKGKTIEELGGWTRVSPDSSEPVFAFKDTLDGTPIIVSQQQLPASFTGDINEQIAELAKEYNATEKLPVAGGIAYVGTSSKGPQSVIANKYNLLILIKATVKHNDDSWTRYLADLN